MKLTSATFTQMAPAFGQYLHRKDDPIKEAATWLWDTHTGKRSHKEVLVQSCMVPVLEPIGVARIDKMLSEESETGFMSGNVSSNLQTSQILPAWNQREVNGFTVIDGVPLYPGTLTNKDLGHFQKSSWNSSEDLAVLREIKKLITPVPLALGKTVDPNVATTLVRVHHMREKYNRSSFPSPVITHGWLLVGRRGEILFEKRLNPAVVGEKMMARAKMALSCERYEAKDVLRIEDGNITFADARVFELLEQQGHDTSKIHISQTPVDGVDSVETPVGG